MAKRVRELEHLRSTNAKHFLRDDGLIEAEITMHPVHYRDKVTGKWRDIDTRHKEKQVQKASRKGRLAKKFDLAVEEAEFQYHLAKFADGWFRFEKDGAAIAWRFPDAKKVRAQVDGSRVIYAGAFGGADLTYLLLPEGVKEEITLPAPGLANAYTVEFEAENCTPRQEANGAISWLDSLGRVAFVTRPPHAEDANGAREVVGTVLEQVDEDSWRLTLVLAQGWLEDPVRVWPVRIDPTITLQPDPTGGKDSFINLNYSDTNYGFSSVLAAGRSSFGDYYRSLIQWTLDSIPAGATVFSAVMSLYCEYVASTNGHTIGAYRITGLWEENTVTWNNQPAHDSTAAATTTVFGADVWYDWNLTSLVQAWVDGTYANYGLMLIGEEGVAGSHKNFWSSDYVNNPSLRPKLIVTYSQPPTTPTNLNPGGSSTVPAVVNTVTPTLSWTFSDPDTGDTQAAYQVLIKRASDGATIKDTGEVASSSTGYTVPSGLLAYGTTYYWQVRVKDPHGLWSGYTTAQYFQPNQSAAAPTSLSPSGTSTTPATLTILTPRLTWQHNDPEGNPQSKYQVQVYRASDNVLVWDSGEVSSSNQYTDVPAGKLAVSTKYYWRVRTADTGSGTFGPYSADAYIYTNAAPYAPTNLTPIAGSMLDPTKNQTFSWTFQDPDIAGNADGQSAYQLLIKKVSTGATVYDSGKVTSTTSQHVLPANTITTGADPDYQWQVRTWDKQDVAGSYSSLVSFRTGTPPVASFTDPVDGGTYPRGILTVAWSYTDAETDPQASFRVVLKDQAGKVLEDSGQVAGDATSYRFNTILSNNTPYRLELTVWDATGQSSMAVSNFTTSFVPPVAPVLSVVPDSAGGKIIVIIGNPDNDPSKPATSYNDLYRRENEGEWIRIVAGMPLNSGYDDYAVSSNTTVEYKAIGVSVDMTTAESNVASASITLSGIWLHDVKSPATTKLNILYNSDIKTNRRFEANFLRFAGRSKPVVEFSPQEEYRYSITLYTTPDYDYWDQLEQLIRSKATLCIRDYRGRKIFGVVTELPENDLFFGEQIALEITEVDYSEAV